MTIEIPRNEYKINEQTIKDATRYFLEGIHNEAIAINKGYNGCETKLWVAGGGYSNDNGIILRKDEAYELLRAFKSAGYHTWIQWTPNQHFMRAILVSIRDRNLSPNYYEKF